MRLWNCILILTLIAGVLAGCGGNTATSADEQGNSAQVVAPDGDTASYTSAVLGTAYEGALPASSQLVLGTFALEDTGDAVTPEQARTLLPLWRAIQADSLQSDAETNAVLKQIEGAMTAGQLAAIAAMQLTVADLGTWMQERGVNPVPPSGAADGAGGFAPPGGMNDEQRAAMRATAQAGGGVPGGGGAFGPPGDLSDEERAAMRATAEANGFTFGGGSGPAAAGSGQLALMAGQAVDLLASRVDK